MTTRYVLRDYQHDTIEKVEAILRPAEVSEDAPTALAILATGLGKTVIACELMRREAERGGRCLFLAHRRELIEQTAATVHRLTSLEPEVEMAERRGVTAGEHRGLFARPPIAVASKDTIVRRLSKISPHSFTLIVIDECHHSESHSYRKTIEHFPNARVLGITATPMRTDGKVLETFKEIAIKIDIVDGVSLGWLVPIDYQPRVVQSLDLSKVAIDRKSKDYAVGELAAAILGEETTRESARLVAEHVRGRHALVFTPNVATAYGMCEALRTLGINAEALDGNSDEQRRADVVERFRRGEVEALCNCALYTEGFDAPICDVVVLLRPTQSIGLYLQMLGRGTRPLPGTVDGLDTPGERHDAIAASSKPKVLVLDLMANAHDKALRAVDLYDALDGSKLSDEERRELEESDGVPTEFEERRRDEIDDIASAEDRAANAAVDPIGRYRELLEKRRKKAEKAVQRKLAEEARRAAREREREQERRSSWTPSTLSDPRARQRLARDMRHLGLTIDTTIDAPTVGPVAASAGSTISRDAGGSKSADVLTQDECVALRRLSIHRFKSGACSHRQAYVLGDVLGAATPYALTRQSATDAMGILKDGKYSDAAKARASAALRYVPALLKDAKHNPG